MKARRTTSGSTPKWRAIPAHTPATTRCSGSRRSAGAGRAAMTRQMVSVATREAARQQRRADDGTGERAERREAQVDRVRRVEHEHDAEQGDEHAGDEGRRVEAPTH